MSRDRALVIGIVGLIGCAIGLVFAPRDALLAWLVCWLGLGAIPIGSLALLMLVALIPGTWRHLYGRPLAIGASLMPIVAIAMIPLLVGATIIFPWTAPGATIELLLRHQIAAGVVGVLGRMLRPEEPHDLPADRQYLLFQQDCP